MPIGTTGTLAWRAASSAPALELAQAAVARARALGEDGDQVAALEVRDHLAQGRPVGRAAAHQDGAASRA